MHPAYSVIIFTTASGAGYGLLAWLGAGAVLGLIPLSWPVGVVGIGLALLLVTAGLATSTLHLGRPERAWRAFSQWRTSWLSREGVLAVATYVPAGLFGLLWVFTNERGFIFGLVAVAAAGLALATVWTTGMIYACLTTVRRWHHPATAPIYVLLALGSGGLLFHVLIAMASVPTAMTVVPAAGLLALGLLAKRHWWWAGDTAGRTHTAESATGLGRFGAVRPLDPPHTEPNFVMREMGYRVGRRHAARLRGIAQVLGFVVPAAALLLLPVVSTWLAIALALLAALACAVGLLVERWLFFAEAQHVVTIYYGAERA
ncbi:MAG: DmsC/YnfH family molybdoenzyme membrane anchor subunit [Hyphomicrobiaceae bacterium]|nr:DmsC/YnfH family molybdoenzyme membrane anchor subunit [Hyphomicrobiaceae bacterium]